MSFRRKNISIVPSRGAPAAPPAPGHGPASPAPQTTPTAPAPQIPGVRPSPQTSHPATSTGTPSLDALLGGHSGLPLGHSLLIEESGTTDFGGALLRYFAAEGALQGHHVTVIGVGEGWVRELPGNISGAEEGAAKAAAVGEKERMKIAWRYERLGEFSGAPGLGGGSTIDRTAGAAPQKVIAPTTGAADSKDKTPASSENKPQIPFCHSFDLTKRLVIPPTANVSTIPLPPPFGNSTSQVSPFTAIFSRITTIIENSPVNSVHRLVFPSLLSPAIYPPNATAPENVLQFLHALKALLRRFGTRAVAMMSLPTELYPRETGMVRWMELLSDGVVEICPLQHLMEKASRIGAKMKDDIPMGVVRVWRVPGGGRIVGGSWAGGAIGGGGAGGGGEDLAFTVTRKRFQISMFSLPPADGDEAEAESHRSGGGGAGAGDDHVHKSTKVDIEF
ncbi:Elongator complex protein 4 [Peziza echinospora]|nr:Elongator complex protein 4 [Peziza echinospora]